MAGAGDATPEQRLAKLQGLLTGTRGDSRIGQALAGAQKRNVLIGAALHGAARLREGRTPTDLEQSLLNMMRTALTDEEIKEWGRVYREVVDRQGGTVDMLPETITRRAVASGYALADLKAGFGPVAQEHLARPNMSVLDAEALAAGGTVDSQAFLNATQQVGFGGTAPRSQPAQGGGQSPAPTYTVKLELESFHVVRTVGDGLGGDDEIYWYVTAASDKKKAPLYKSQEFGEATKGKTFSFPPSNRVVFEGAVSSGVVLYVACWEADQSSSEWYDKLQTAMQALNDQLFNTWQWQFTGLVADPGVIGGLMLEMIGVFATLIALWRNEDDLSCERGIALDQQTLAVLTRRGSADWQFNGDGHHTLKIRSSGPQVPFPSGILEYAVRTGESWGAPITLPWQSMTPPALASYGGKLYAVFIRHGDEAVMWTRLDGQAWSAPQRISSDTSLFAPALCAAHGKLFYAVTGMNGSLYWRTFTESGGWGGVTKFEGYGSSMAPSMAAYSGRVWLTHVGGDGKLWLNTHNGTSWSQVYGDNLDWRVGNPLAMAAHDNVVWRISSGTGGTFLSTSDGGARWTDRGHHTSVNWISPRGSAAAEHRGKLWITLRGQDGILRSHSSGGPFEAINPYKATTAMGEPAAASHNNKLYVMYRR